MRIAGACSAIAELTRLPHPDRAASALAV